MMVDSKAEVVDEEAAVNMDCLGNGAGSSWH